MEDGAEGRFDRGKFVGCYWDADGTYHGFPRKVGGIITVIDNPDAVSASGNGSLGPSRQRQGRHRRIPRR